MDRDILKKVDLKYWKIHYVKKVHVMYCNNKLTIISYFKQNPIRQNNKTADIVAATTGKTNLTSNNLILPLPLIFSCFFAFFTAIICIRAGIANKKIDKIPSHTLFEKNQYYQCDECN